MTQIYATGMEIRSYVAAEMYAEICEQNVQCYSLKIECLVKEYARLLMNFTAKIEVFLCNFQYLR